jgi:hypothetical protein
MLSSAYYNVILKIGYSYLNSYLKRIGKSDNVLRNDIYEGVLYVPHLLYLFQDTGSRVETFAPEGPR